MKVYISIPITGKDIEVQKKYADDMAKFLTKAGHTPVLPFDNGLDESASYEEHIKADLKLLLDCNAILMCKDYHLSNGCLFEFDVAIECGMTVVTDYMPIDKILTKLQEGKR